MKGEGKPFCLIIALLAIKKKIKFVAKYPFASPCAVASVVAGNECTFRQAALRGEIIVRRGKEALSKNTYL